jgi:hypothetical protein
MCIQRPRRKVLIANVIAAIIAILVFGLATSDAKTPLPSPFLSPTSLTPRAWLPVILKNFPPIPTISRYVSTTDWQTLHDLGCNRGTTILPGQDDIIILDFGYPAYDSSSGQYGVWLFSGPFRSTAQITNAVEGFMSGFYNCSPSGVKLTVAVGVNNSGAGVTREHGMAWAQMVNNLNAWIVGPPYPSYADKLTAYGAIDAEPGFGTAAATRAWVDGYAAGFIGLSKYVNFGSCDSCPFTGCPTCVPSNGWTLDDIWYVSWKLLPALPLPEIYRTDGANADQWYRMSLYSYTNHNSRMNFVGSLTQWNACQEVGGCAGTDNSPGDGYLQLYNAINADSRTAWSMPWSTDMSWQK